jgi:hypothetical protein
VLRQRELPRLRVPLLVHEDRLGLEVDLAPAQRVELAGSHPLVDRGVEIAGLIVLAVAYWFVETKLSLRERAERAHENEEQRHRTREAVLRTVHEELESNAAQLTNAFTVLPKKDELLLFPLFDVSLWPIVSSTGVFANLSPETATALVHAYNRMTTANEQNAALLDLTQGRTAMLFAMGAASAQDKQTAGELYAAFKTQRVRRRDELLDRLQDLKEHLDTAIDAVELELRLDLPNRAADRHYVSEPPQGP